jgi:hypothetical protein
LEVVDSIKKKITGRSHIKSVDNMDFKNESNDLYGNISKNYAVLKRNDTKNGLWM